MRRRKPTTRWITTTGYALDWGTASEWSGKRLWLAISRIRSYSPWTWFKTGEQGACQGVPGNRLPGTLALLALLQVTHRNRLRINSLRAGNTVPNPWAILALLHPWHCWVQPQRWPESGLLEPALAQGNGNVATANNNTNSNHKRFRPGEGNRLPIGGQLFRTPWPRRYHPTETMEPCPFEKESGRQD